MAYGYEKCFIVEHDTTVKRTIDCKSCWNYEKEDRSCMKRALYLPVDGYNSWRNCDFFELDPSTSHYHEKERQYEAHLRRRPIKKDAVPEIKVERPVKVFLWGNPKVHVVDEFDEDLITDYRKIHFKLLDGKRTYILAGLNKKTGHIYVNKICGEKILKFFEAAYTVQDIEKRFGSNNTYKG